MAVIPNNKDITLNNGDFSEYFWEKVKKWQNKDGLLRCMGTLMSTTMYQVINRFYHYIIEVNFLALATNSRPIKS